MNPPGTHPLSTRDVASALAEAARAFPILGLNSADQLLEVVRLELGHGDILDGFAPYGSHLARAIPVGRILHIVSGNTPHAALQSLIRGLLLQSHNRLKLPSEGLPEVDRFVSLLPVELAARVELSRDLPADWIPWAEAVVVFGSDETIVHFRRLVPVSKIFLPHGHRVSFGVVFDDPGFLSVAAAARDISRFDQQGCLSPHAFYVAGDARAYAERLAAEMEAYNRTEPRGKISVAESEAILHLRAGYRFRAASDHRVAIWCSEPGDDWTVIYEDDPLFSPSCLNRLVFVKPLLEDLAASISPVSPWLGAIGIWPATKANLARVAELGASRLCPIGRMQAPPFTWHQDGGATLSPLVRWVDAECDASTP